MGLLQNKDFLQPMVYVVKWCSSSSLTWKLKRSISKKSLLDACHPFGDCGHMKICRRVSPIMVYGGASLSHNGVWGSNLQVFIKRGLCQQARSRKVFQLERVKIVFIELKWNAQGKGMILIGFLFYRSHAFGRPGYRIDSRTIKRGSQVSNLIESLWRAQTFAYLAYHLSWFLFVFFSLWGFGACCDLHDKLRFTENGLRKKNLQHFRCWRFYRLIFIERSNLYPFGFIFHCWTMMFLCIILQLYSLLVQQAKNH